MAYGLKYTLSFLSDRGNDYRIEILAKDYQGAPIAKKMGVAPVLNIAQGDGCIQGSSLTFAVQADVDGELQEFYTTDNKKFQILLYRNGAIMWQGYLLPELYSETYVAPPYDVSLTATDQLATLKDIEYSREDEQVLLQTVLEYLLSHTQLSLPLSYHMQLSMAPGRPMLENVYINQSAYNGSNCYDVLNAILLSMNCRIMQLGNQWLVTSATDSSENYYTERNLEVRPHKTLGQMYVADVYPNGTLGLVNSPALKGATLEYSHIFKKSILKNADCESRVGWEYMSHSSDDGRLPGEITSFGKIFKAYCWQLMPKNIQKDASLHLWQDVEMPADDGVTWSLSFKHLFSTNAKLLLLAITHWDDSGVQRRLTGEGWVTQWDSANVNSYIQVTGTPKSASLAEYSDVEQYEMSTVQFTLPPSNGTLRIGFINSTANYADPLAYAPIYVTQVYLTLGAVSGSAATTIIEPNATMGQEGVVLAMGDDVDSSNAVNVALNTLRRYDGGAIAGWMIGDRQFSSYFSMMLQEYSRYFGQKKRQLQGTIMGVDVLANIYKETYSNTIYRLISADYNLLADEANVTLEEVLSNFVQFAEQIFATNNSNSFGSPTSGGSFSGGSSSVDTSQLLRRDEAAETYATKAALADVNKEIADINNDLDALNELLNSDVSGVINTWGEIVDFLDEYNESQDLASILSQMNSDIANRVHYDDFEKLQEAVDANYGAIQTLQGRVGIAEGTINSHTADIVANTKAITAIDNRVDVLEALGFVLKDGYIYTEKTIVSKGEIISGRRASGSSSDVTGGGGISQVTAQMIVDALGYVPYSSQNPSGYITSSALNGYATQAWVEGKKYLTAHQDISHLLSKTDAANTYQPKGNYLTSVSWSDVSGKPSFATVATSGKYSDLSGVPTSLPASDVYAWAKAATKPTYTASEVGALSTSGGTISGNYNAFTLNRNTANPSIMGFSNTAGMLGYLGMKWGNAPVFVDADVANIYDLLHSGNYSSYALPLSGGTRTITSTANTSLILKTDGWHSLIQLDNNHGNSVLFGYYSGSGAVMQNGSNYLAIKDDGTPHYNNNELYHTGNFNPANYLPLSGGTMTGAIVIGGYTSFGVSDGIFYLGNPSYPVYVRSNGIVNINGNAVIHAGNIGSYAFIPRADNLISNVNADHYWVNGAYLNQTGNGSGNSNFPNNYAMFLSFNNGASNYVTQFDMGRSAAYYRTKIDSWSKWYQFITDENIGSQSVSYASNAGLLGGLSEGEFAKNLNNTANINIDNATSGLIGGKLYGASGTFANNYGTLNYGPFLAFGYGGYEVQISSRSHTTWLRTKENSEASSWRQLAFTDSNVASATKLQTARTIWGQSFDGTGNVSGILLLNNGVSIQSKDSSGVNRDIVYMTAANHLVFGTGVHSAGGDTYIGGKALHLRYGTTPTIGLTLNNSGNILIGTAEDRDGKLQINGKTRIYRSGDVSTYLDIEVGDVNVAYNGVDSGDGFCHHIFKSNGTTLLELNGYYKGVYIYGGLEVTGGGNFGGNTSISGNLTATGEVISSRRASSSDRRLKNNITYLDTADCLAMVRQIRPAEWDWKDNGKHSMGFIAQDVEHLMPYAVTSIKDNVLGQKLNLQYDQFIALAIGGVQEVDNEVERLKARVEYLENKIKEYEYGNYRN